MLLYSTDVADASTNSRPRTDEMKEPQSIGLTSMYKTKFWNKKSYCYAISKAEVRKRSA